jgi:ADP-ribose pyrophosphatase
MTSQPERPSARQLRADSARVVYDGLIFKVWQWDQPIASGQAVRYETLSRADTALVLPVLPDGRIAFAVESQPGGHPEVRAFGGKIEEGESAVDGAARELREEAGYVASSLELWVAWQPVEKIDWAVYIFVASGISTGHGQDLDLGEQVGARYLPAESLLSASGRGLISDPELKYALATAEESDAELQRLRRLLRVGSGR